MTEPKKGGKRFFRAATKDEPEAPGDDDVTVPVQTEKHAPKSKGSGPKTTVEIAAWLEARGQAEAASLIRRKLLGESNE